MISINSSLWFDRKAKCPHCNKLVGVNVDRCPCCNYELTQEEILFLRKEATNQFKRSAIIGLVTVSIFLFILAVVLNKILA